MSWLPSENLNRSLPILCVLATALCVRLVIFSGVLGYDSLNYAHWAYDISHGVYPGLSGIEGFSLRMGLIAPVALSYRLFGVSEFTTVLIPLVLSLVGTYYVYLIGTDVASESAGLIGALLWALFPAHVFLSTELYPDAPMAAVVAISFYYLMRGANSSTPRKRTALYGAGVAIAVWAFFIKQLAILQFFFIALILIAAGLRRPALLMIEKWRIRNPRERVLLSVLAASLVAALILAYSRFQPSPITFWLSHTATDLSDKFISGITIERYLGNYSFSTNMFISLGVLFFVSMIYSLAQRLTRQRLLLAWVLFNFLYYEWGTISTNLLVYNPLVSLTQDRNILFIVVGVCITVGIYVSRGLQPEETRRVILLSCSLILVILVKLRLTSDLSFLTSGVILVAIAVSILGAVFSPLFFRPEGDERVRKSFALVWLPALFISLLYPSPPLSTSFPLWQVQREYRDTLRETGVFLGQKPEASIFFLSEDNAREFNFATDFEYGYQWAESGYDPPGARILVLASQDFEQVSRGSFVVFRDESDRSIPGDWQLAGLYTLSSSDIPPIRIYWVP